MKPGVKQDLVFAIVSALVFCGYLTAGFATGRIAFGHAADMILTDWTLFGLGGFFVAAILYAGVKPALLRKSRTAVAPPADGASHLSGRSVAAVVALSAIALIGVVAWTIIADS